MATILGTLRVAGGEVQHALGSQVRIPPAPMTANVFPVLMMMGMMVLAINLGVSIWIATVANDVFGNPVATINAAAAGSDLLDDLRFVQTTQAWLAPFKFVGIALLLSGIATALFTIILALRAQTMRLTQILGES